jgi:hypothetical protein
LNEANPELLDELSRISSRSRAERLRVLAYMGLSLSRGAAMPGSTLDRPMQVPARVAPSPGTDTERESPVMQQPHAESAHSAAPAAEGEAENGKKQPSRQLLRFARSLS